MRNHVQKDYDVIVVGGGMAGLTATAFLCRDGYRTLLCEKSHKVGGLVNTFWRQGFAFDFGLRAIEDSGIILPMLKTLGIELDLAENPVSIGIANDRVELGPNTSLDDYKNLLKKYFPENIADIDEIGKEITKVMRYMDVLYGIENPLFLDDYSDLEYITKTLLPWFLKYQVNIRKASRLSDPVNKHLRKFTSNTALIDIITQHFFKNTPAFFGLSYFGVYQDYAYPLGGTSSLPEKMSEYILGKKGEIRTDTEVAALNLDKSEIQIANQEFLQYKKLIWAADQKTLYNQASGEISPSITKQQAKVEQASGGDSVFSLYLAVNLDKNYFTERSGPHIFYTPTSNGLRSLPEWRSLEKKDKHALFDWLKKYFVNTTYEISIPVLRDSSLAPQGNTGIIVSALLDYDLVQQFLDNDSYQEFKEIAANIIIETLANTIFPGFDKHIKFSFSSTPRTIAEATGNSGGAITGWAFDSTMPAENRFPKIAKSVNTPFNDVYQCGQWSFSPAGLPISILTGKLAADSTKKKLKKER